MPIQVSIYNIAVRLGQLDWFAIYKVGCLGLFLGAFTIGLILKTLWMRYQVRSGVAESLLLGSGLALLGGVCDLIGFPLTSPICLLAWWQFPDLLDRFGLLIRCGAVLLVVVVVSLESMLADVIVVRRLLGHHGAVDDSRRYASAALYFVNLISMSVGFAGMIASAGSSRWVLGP